MAVLAVAGVGVVAHVAAAWVLARPPPSLPDHAEYLVRWSRLHGGYDPRGNRWVRGWLGLTFVTARPFARRGVHPDALTGLTVWFGVVALATVEAGGAWPLLGAGVIVLSGLGDAVDGAVAVLTDRATRWGYLLDSLVDRVNDCVFVGALWRLGAPLELAAATGVGLLLLEYARARGSNAGAGEIGAVTVGERASRVVCAAVGLAGAGALPEHAGWWGTGSLLVLAALTAVGSAQLLLALRRALR